jgi:small nuclear ribonucleoprotein (snRNP)-like protein
VTHKDPTQTKSTMDDPAVFREKDPPRGPPPPGASSSSAPSTENRTGIKSNNKKSSAASFRSLGRMLQYLDQQLVTVELKNGIRYTGMLDSDGCDDNFNVTLRDACTDVPHHHHQGAKTRNHHHRRRRPGSLSHHPPPHRQPADRRDRDPAELPSSSSHPFPPPSPNSNSSDTSSHGVLLSVLQVRGSTVRYILLGDLDLTRLVSSGLERERRARTANQRVALQPKKNHAAAGGPS